MLPVFAEKECKQQFLYDCAAYQRQLARNYVSRENLYEDVIRLVLPDMLLCEFSLCILEDVDHASVEGPWVCGLRHIPNVYFTDAWLFKNFTPIIFSDYYAAIEVDLSLARKNWNSWVATLCPSAVTSTALCSSSLALETPTSLH